MSVYVVDVESESGASAGRRWVRHKIMFSNGMELFTYDHRLACLAAGAQALGYPVLPARGPVGDALHYLVVLDVCRE